MAKKTVTWVGSKNCDFCKKECAHILIDGKTIYGPWAVMCHECYNEYGVGLGVGKGQLYEKNKNGVFEQITPPESF